MCKEIKVFGAVDSDHLAAGGICGILPQDLLAGVATVTSGVPAISSYKS